MDLDELKARAQRGERLKFLLFWVTRADEGAPVAASCLSQWFPASFTVAGLAIKPLSTG